MSYVNQKKDSYGTKPNRTEAVLRKKEQIENEKREKNTENREHKSNHVIQLFLYLYLYHSDSLFNTYAALCTELLKTQTEKERQQKKTIKHNKYTIYCIETECQKQLPTQFIDLYALCVVVSIYVVCAFFVHFVQTHSAVN